MGKKDSKKVDKEKLEAKKVRQAAKVQKTTTKRVKKEIKESGEDDIEAIIAEFSAKDAARVAVTITASDQPSPRANFSMTALPNGDMLLFGGEFCDGENTEVYNNLYRWNMEKNEWKHIESLNTPPPRCSHQAIYYKEKLYVFGGEYATLDQFHHYRDFWELDLKTSTWTEIKPVGDAPNARSGHRMVVWRNFLVLFGGFYEAMREVRWYNDLYIFSFQDQRWVSIPHKANMQAPKPRSGVQMCAHAQDDVIYIYGGYSKEKVTGSKKEGKVHEDMWCLNLKPMLAAAGAVTAGRAGGIGSIDTSKAAWQKITRKGDFPTARCGAGMTMYKNKALLFGGVFDDEGPRHSLISTFYNDLFAFDMERKRWYKLGLKQKKLKIKLTSADKKAKKIQRLAARALNKENNGGDGDEEGSDVGEDDDDEDLDSDSDDEGDDNDPNSHSHNVNAETDRINANVKKGELFGYIDEYGQVVYINMNDEDDDDEEEVETAPSSLKDVTEKVHNLNLATTSTSTTPMDTEVETVFNTTTIATNNTDVVDAAAEKRYAESLKNQEKYRKKAEKDSLAEYLGMDVEVSQGDSGVQEIEKTAAETANQTFIAKYFAEQTVPCTRINPCMLIRGNTLYIYGGVTELGDIEVTLDDCWSLDLNKRDNWKKVLGGSMHLLVWKGVEDEDDANSSHYSGLDSESDDDDDDDEDDDDDDEEEEEQPKKRSSKKISTTDTSEKRDKKGEKKDKGEKSDKVKKEKSGGSSKGGLRAEMEGLRSHFDMTDSNRTPLGDETLRQFYSRTTEYWATQVISLWHAKQEQMIADGTVNKNETLSEKEIKRQGFALSEERYNELLPHITRLNELETQQREEEEYSARHDSKSGKSSKGGSSKNR